MSAGFEALRTKARLARRYAATRLPDAVGQHLIPRAERYTPAAVPPPVSSPTGAETRLLIAPANVAGQGYAWARAAERLPGVGGVSVQYRDDVDLGFPSDYAVPFAVFATSGDWARRQKTAVAHGFTHVLVESSRPIFGSAFRGLEREVRWMRSNGLSVGVVGHGSDLRIPSRHATLDEWSPFRRSDEEWVRRLESKVAGVHAALRSIDAPVFVSTPDLLLDWPSSVWLPLVVDQARWHAEEPALADGRRPRVIHAPTNALVKGTAAIEPIVEDLAATGLIEYERVSGVPAERMPDVVRSSDIVLEQFALGMYSATAIEAMAAGRLVVGHVHDQVRNHVESMTGMRPPVVEATPATIRDVIVDICARREEYRSIAASGPRFAAAVHDGRLSARVLAPFLEVEDEV